MCSQNILSDKSIWQSWMQGSKSCLNANSEQEIKNSRYNHVSTSTDDFTGDRQNVSRQAITWQCEGNEWIQHKCMPIGVKYKTKLLRKLLSTNKVLQWLTTLFNTACTHEMSALLMRFTVAKCKNGPTMTHYSVQYYVYTWSRCRHCLWDLQ